jgi:hypothetical protein
METEGAVHHSSDDIGAIAAALARAQAELTNPEKALTAGGLQVSKLFDARVIDVHRAHDRRTEETSVLHQVGDDLRRYFK